MPLEASSRWSSSSNNKMDQYPCTGLSLGSKVLRVALSRFRLHGPAATCGRGHQGRQHLSLQSQQQGARGDLQIFKGSPRQMTPGLGGVRACHIVVNIVQVALQAQHLGWPRQRLQICLTFHRLSRGKKAVKQCHGSSSSNNNNKHPLCRRAAHTGARSTQRRVAAGEERGASARLRSYAHLVGPAPTQLAHQLRQQQRRRRPWPQWRKK